MRPQVRSLLLATIIGLPASLVGVAFGMIGAHTGSDFVLFMAGILCLPIVILAYAVRPLVAHLGEEGRVVLFALTQFLYYYVAVLLAGRFGHWYRGKPYPTGHCQKCGYNLTGNVSGRCSECGTDVGFDYHAIRRAQIKKYATWFLLVVVAVLITLSGRVSKSDSLSSISVWALAMVILIPTAVWLFLRKR